MALDVLIQRLRAELQGRAEPLFVGVDGRSGAGKSTLAAAIADELGHATVTVIEGDEFYAGGSSESWDRRSAEEKADHVIDWRRQANVLSNLRAGGRAEWFPFDWEASDWDGEPAPLSRQAVRAECQPVVILEGAYSCRPELHPRARGSSTASATRSGFATGVCEPSSPTSVGSAGSSTTTTCATPTKWARRRSSNS